MHIVADRHEPPERAQANQGLCWNSRGQGVQFYGSIRVEITSRAGEAKDSIPYPIPEEHDEPEGKREGKRALGAKPSFSDPNHHDP